MMKKELQKPLEDLIEESYGTPEELAKVLDLGIEMLFYVDEGTFSRADIQNVAAALRSICGVLRG